MHRLGRDFVPGSFVYALLRVLLKHSVFVGDKLLGQLGIFNILLSLDILLLSCDRSLSQLVPLSRFALRFSPLLFFFSAFLQEVNEYSIRAQT